MRRKWFCRLLTVLWLGTALTAACGGGRGQPMPTATPPPPSATPTMAIPTPTATPAPTATATSVPLPPAEFVAKYELCADWQEAEKCPIPWEDIKNGVPGKIARLNGEPFPDTAYNTGKIYLMEEKGYTHLTWGWGTQPEDIDYRSNPETRPYRWVGFFSTVDSDGVKYLGGVQQWLNPSGKISYLTYIVLSEAATYWQQMAVGWPMVEDLRPDGGCGYGIDYYCETMSDKETIRLLHLWQETGEIPEELQDRVIYAYVNTTGFYIPIAP